MDKLNWQLRGIYNYRIFFTLLLSFSSIVCLGENLLKNPSFEEVSTDKNLEHGKESKVISWEAYYYPQNGYAGGISKENPHSGENCAFIETPAAIKPAKTIFWQSASLPAKNGQRYELSVWVKSENLKVENNWHKVRIYALYLDKDGKRLKHQDIIVIGENSQDWKKFKKDFRIPPIKNLAKMKICLAMSYCSGKVFFDDVSLELIKEKKMTFTNAPVNIFPAPKKVKITGESFTLSTLNLDWEKIPANPQKEYIRSNLKKFLATKKISQDDKGVPLKISIDRNLNPNDQYYKLSVSAKEISVQGASLRGVLYGLQTFKMLLGSSNSIQAVEIEDWPDFKVRGIISGSFSVNAMEEVAPYKINLYWPCKGTYPCREWTRPMTSKEKEEFATLIKGAEKRMMTIVFGMRPGWGNVDLHFCDPEHLDAIKKKFKDYYDLGLRNFSLAFDDLFNIGRDKLSYKDDKKRFKNIGEAHFWLSNEIYKYLKSLNKNNRLYIVPMYYYDPTPYSEYEKNYLKTLGRLPLEVRFINAGTLLDSQIANLEKLIRRKPFFWSNFMAQFEKTKPFPQILTPLDFQYSSKIADEFPGFMFVARPKHIMMKQLFSDFMWNAKKFDPEKSHASSMNLILGEDADILAQYMKSKENIKSYPFAGVHKEEMLILTKNMLKNIEAWKKRLKDIPAGKRKKIYNEIDGILKNYNILLQDLAKREMPFKIFQTEDGFEGLKTEIKNFILPVSKWKRETETHPEAGTTVKLGWDSSSLYIQFICQEPELNKIRAKQKERDSMIFVDDCVELFLMPPEEKGNYFHIAVNSLGAIYDAKNFDKSWNGKYEAKTEQTNDSWILSLKIAWKELGGIPRKGQIWKVNFCRSRTLNKETSSAFMLLGKFHEKERFWPMMFD